MCDGPCGAIWSEISRKGQNCNHRGALSAKVREITHPTLHPDRVRASSWPKYSRRRVRCARKRVQWTLFSSERPARRGAGACRWSWEPPAGIFIEQMNAKGRVRACHAPFSGDQAAIGGGADQGLHDLAFGLVCGEVNFGELFGAAHG